MLESLSTKAVLTKVKAMYGRMLTTQDYEQLMHKTSVPACAAYLKSQTHYAAIMRDVQETQIHRGALEAILRRSMFEQFLRLYRYAGHQNRFLQEYHIRRLEIRSIISCIRMLASEGDTGVNEFIASLPGYAVPYMSFDILSLGSVQNWSQLLDALQKTSYGKALANLRPREGETIPPMTLIEHALYQYYYDYIFELIDKEYQGTTAKELRSIFSAQAQLFNIRAAYRMKRFYSGHSSDLDHLMLHYQGRLPSSIIRQIATAPDAESVLNILSRTKYGQYFNPDDFSFIEYGVGRIRWDICKRYLTFSQNPATVFVSFLFLTEIEIENLVNIIESVRYGLDIPQIRALLIGGAA